MATNKMNKLFLVLGIGIGLLVSSLLNMAYPKIKYEDYSEEQIVEKAKELGMVSIKEAISMKERKSEETDVNEEVADPIIEDNYPEEEDKHPIEFVINKGDNSEEIVDKLFEKGIIKDKEDFIKKIIEDNLQRKFKYGIYELEPEMDYESLIKVLIGK